MASEEVLRKTLKNADGKPFAKYKGLENSFVLEDYEIIFDNVQNDKTGHTYMRVRVPLKKAGFPSELYSTKIRSMALRDLIARRFWESARTHARAPIPKTTGGELFIPRPGQEILDRGSIAITEYYVEVRFTADLPSDNGKASMMAMDLLFERIRTVVSESLYFSAYKQSKVLNHMETCENAEFIRNNLRSKGLAAFVADGSVLPRRDDDLAPMIDAIPFSCDDSLRVAFDVPNGDPITGMGIPQGFTVMTGPGRNGKSVLADAIFAGVYDHIPGDGREYVITDASASFVMSESGRCADDVDISMFVSETKEFEDTSRARKNSVSSSMSEFVAVSEAVEMGSKLIIMDEGYSDPSAIRRGFLSGDDPITPVSELGSSMGKKGISLILVSGDESAIRHADNVFLIEGFKAYPAKVDRMESDKEYRLPASRCPVSKTIVYEKGRKEVSVTAKSIRTVEIGEFDVNVPVAALFDISQTRTVADAATVMKDLMDGTDTMLNICTRSIQTVESSDDTSRMYHVSIRPIDLAAVLNRHPQMLAIQKR